MTDEAALCREYEAGDSLRTLAKRHALPREKVRGVLVAHGIAIRSANDNTAKAMLTSSIVRDARIRDVVVMIVRGVTDRHEIFADVNDPEGPHRWNIALATVDEYLGDARALLRERTTAEVEDLRAVADARYEQLYRSADAPRDRLAVLADWNKFWGLYPAAKLEHSGTITWQEMIEIATGDAPPE